MSWTRRPIIAALALVAAALLAFVGAHAGTAAATASSSSCPGQGNAGAAVTPQERTMLCLVNRARKARGLSPLAAPASLAKAAARKSGDILRCDEFSHEACGRELTYWLDRVGYTGCRELEGHGGAHVWTQELGSREC